MGDDDVTPAELRRRACKAAWVDEDFGPPWWGPEAVELTPIEWMICHGDGDGFFTVYGGVMGCPHPKEFAEFLAVCTPELIIDLVDEADKARHPWSSLYDHVLARYRGWWCAVWLKVTGHTWYPEED